MLRPNSDVFRFMSVLNDLSISKVPNNAFFISRDTADKEDDGTPFYYSSTICDYDSLGGHARHFPIFIIPKPTKPTKNTKTPKAKAFDFEPIVSANLSPKARAYLASLGITDVDVNSKHAALIWQHALAIGYSPAYRRENADGIGENYPRIPLPATRDQLEASAALGRQVAARLDTTVSFRQPSLNPVGRWQSSASQPDSAVKKWGNLTKSGVQPQKGSVKPLTEGMLRIHANATTYWDNIPQEVWNYTIGGYQVLKKWLSYRDESILGRPLSWTLHIQVG